MLSNVAIRRPVATAMIIMMVVVVGFFSFISLPQDLMPDMQFPLAIVVTTFPNAGPEEVENMVTAPIESVLASVENLDEIASMSLQGQSIVMLQFHFDTDMNFATLDMYESIALIEGSLPDTAGSPMVFVMDMGAGPMMQVFVSSDMPLAQLYRDVDNNLLSYFERARGVATVGVAGGLTEEISIVLNPETLLGLGLSIQQISQMLTAENINLPSGNVTRGSTEVIVRTMGQFNSVDDIRNLPITLADRSIVRLQDVATINQEYRDRRTYRRINGEASISLSITKQSDANTVDVSTSIRRVVADLESRFPQYTFTIGFDEAEYINQSLTSVGRAALVGGILAIFGVFLFLRNFRTTLVIAISIPVSLLATFALMDFRYMTLNLITLSALGLAVGLLIDNSIIVLENIFRTRQFVDDPKEAARQGASEVFVAVLAATLTSVVIFLPIAMAGGFAGLMFADFSFTVVIALLASLFVAITAVPMLCSKLLTRGVSTDYVRFGSRRYKFKLITKFSVFIDFLIRKYDSIIRVALVKRKRVIFSCIGLFILSLGLIGVVGVEMMPSADEGTFTVNVETPFGTPLQTENDFVREIEEIILAIPEVRNLSVLVGGAGGMFGVGGSNSSLSVTLVPQAERSRSTAEVRDEVRAAVAHKVGANITFGGGGMMDMMMGGMDMGVYLVGPDLGVLENIGNDLISMLLTQPDIYSAELGVSEGNPELRLILDRNIAAHYGINSSTLASSLSTALIGTTATRLSVNGEEIDVVLSMPDTFADSIDNMQQIMVTGTAGIPVPVGQITTMEFANAPEAINRWNMQRYLLLEISFDTNNLATSAANVRAIIDSYHFPDGYFHETIGTQEQMIEAFTSLIYAFIIAIALVYLVLAAQFESLVLPFIVTTSIPFAMSGAFFALFITGTALSLTSLLGLIMLVGIVINNSILLVTFITQYREKMGRNEALVEAGKVRLRPILMTALTTCLAMLPISLSIGEGTEMMAPMGIAIIGGLLASTAVTLIFVPVLYSILDDGKQKRLAKKALRHERILALEAKWQEEDALNAR